MNPAAPVSVVAGGGPRGLVQSECSKAELRLNLTPSAHFSAASSAPDCFNNVFCPCPVVPRIVYREPFLRLEQPRLFHLAQCHPALLHLREHHVDLFPGGRKVQRGHLRCPLRAVAGS